VPVSSDGVVVVALPSCRLAVPPRNTRDEREQLERFHKWVDFELTNPEQVDEGALKVMHAALSQMAGGVCGTESLVWRVCRTQVLTLGTASAVQQEVLGYDG
jgi:hypothetical protein